MKKRNTDVIGWSDTTQRLTLPPSNKNRFQIHINYSFQTLLWLPQTPIPNPNPFTSSLQYNSDANDLKLGFALFESNSKWRSPVVLLVVPHLHRRRHHKNKLTSLDSQNLSLLLVPPPLIFIVTPNWRRLIWFIVHFQAFALVLLKW